MAPAWQETFLFPPALLGAWCLVCPRKERDCSRSAAACRAGAGQAASHRHQRCSLSPRAEGLSLLLPWQHGVGSVLIWTCLASAPTKGVLPARQPQELLPALASPCYSRAGGTQPRGRPVLPWAVPPRAGSLCLERGSCPKMQLSA